MMIIIKCYVCLLFSVKWFQDVSVLFWEFKAYFSDRQVNIMTHNYFIIISCRHRPGGGWTVTIKSQFTSTSASHPQSDRTSHLDALQGFNLMFSGSLICWFCEASRLVWVSSASHWQTAARSAWWRLRTFKAFYLQSGLVQAACLRVRQWMEGK